MKSFFYPESIVIYGVSAAPGNLAAGILANLERFTFKGDISLVGEKGGFIGGRPIFKNLEEMDSLPDVAVFVIPAKAIPEKLEECGRKGVRYAVIESGGFSEFGKEKEILEKKIITIAEKWGIKILGPNCLGTVNVENGMVLPFVPFHESFLAQGPVSVISQSGGILHDLLLLLSYDHLGVNKLVSAGNKLMLDENDFLEYFIEDQETQMIALYLEDIRDGRRLADLALTTTKPIVLLKANESPGTSRIARLHTASLAGDDLVADTLLRQAGIHRVYSLHDMINALKAFSMPLMRGERLAVIARSGGHAVMATDAIYRHGFRLATLSQEIFNLVGKKKKADVIRATNPLDLGDIFDIDFHFTILEKTVDEKGVDGVLFIHSYDLETEENATLDFIQKVNALSMTHTKPVAFCMLSEKEEWFRMKDTARFPVFSEADQAIRALSSSLRHFRGTSKRKISKEQVPVYFARPKTIPKGQASFMSAIEAFTLLSQYGLPVAQYEIARNIQEAREAARKLGYPVALKVASSGIVHKTEKGGVRLDVASDAALKGTLDGMNADIFLVQKMAKQGHEVILGAKRDPAFGHVLMFGMGGIYAELFKDISVRMVPVNEKTALTMIDEIRGVAILKGYRGQPPCDLRAVAQSIVRLSRLLTDHPEIVHLDINPLIVYEKGNGCVIVDAKIEAIQ